MSKTIDERVVSMQFDNKNFESNVKTTMSTLEKLKSRLNLSGAAKGLESVNAAANKCDLAPIGNAVDGVRVKFSTLQVAALTCLQNITNQAFNTGKRMLSSLTVEPITTGFNEYELKMNSVQTIMASTGESLSTVNQYLNELNKYSDETIYSFADMTQNIGKFTNAGIKLEDAVIAIKGIANEAALSGANANEASRAMYNFSQALSTGYVQRIDWKSIELANMATVEFKTQLLEQAVQMKTVEKNAEGMYKALGDDTYYNTSQMFIEALDEQWLTSEVLIETLKNYASTTTDIGQRATEAATQVKTFSHMMDTLRESAQSGWAQTWELVFGDFDEGKNLWTSLNKVIGGVIDKMSDRRNKNLGEALNSNWEKLVEKIMDAGIGTSEFEDSLKSALTAGGHDVDKLIEEYETLENIFVSGAASSDILKAAIEALNGSVGEVTEQLYDISGIDRTLGFGAVGDDVKKVQTALETLGYTLARFGVDGIIGAETTAAIRQFQSDRGLKITGIIDAETLAALEEASVITKELSDENRKLVESYEEICDAIDNVGGRQRIIDSFVKLFEKLQPIFDSFKKKWDEAFADFPSLGDVISTCIDNFATFVDNLEFGKDTLAEIDTVIQGFISSLQTLSLLSGGIWGFMVKMLKRVASNLGYNLWDMTVIIADLITKFYQWISTNNVLYESLYALGDTVVNFITSTVDGIRAWFTEFSKIGYVSNRIEKLGDAFVNVLSTIRGWLEKFLPIFSNFVTALFDMDSITLDGLGKAFVDLLSGVIDQFVSLDGLFDNVFKGLLDIVLAFFAQLGNSSGTVEEFYENLNKLRESTDRVTKPIGKLVDKIFEFGKALSKWVTSLKDVEDLPKAIGEGIGTVIGNILVYIEDALIQLGKDLWAGMNGAATDGIAGFVIGLVKGLINVVGIVFNIGAAMISTIKEVLDSHSPSKVMISIGEDTTTGLAIGLANGASVVWDAIVDFGSEMITKFSTVIVNVLNWLKNINFGQVLSLAVTGGMLAFAVTIVKIGMRIADAVADITEGVAAMAKGAGKILGNIGNIFGEIAKNQKAKRFAIYAEGIKSLAIAIGILAASIAVLTLVAKHGDMWAAVGAIAAIMGIFAAFAAVIAVAEYFGKVSALDFGALALGMLGISTGIFIIASAAKKLGEVPIEKIDSVIYGMIGFMLGLTAMITLFGAFAKSDVVSSIDKLGPVLVRIGVLMLAMAFAAKMVGSLTAPQFEQAYDAIIAFGLVIAGLMTVSSFAGGKLDSVGNTFLKIGGVFLMMAYSVEYLNKFTQPQLDQAKNTITAFSGIILATVLMMRLISLIPKKSGEKSRSKIAGIGLTILQIAGAILMVSAAAAILGQLKPEQIIQAGIAIAVFGAGIYFMVKMFDNINVWSLTDVGSTILMIAGAMLVLSVAAKIFGSIQFGDLVQAGLAIAVLGAGIYAMIQMLDNINAGNLSGIGVTVLMAAGAIAILATIAGVIGLLDPWALTQGVVAVSVLGAVIAGIIRATENAGDAKGNLIGVAVVMAILAATIAALSFIAKDDPFALLGAVGATVAAMVVLGQTLKSIGKLNLNVKPLLAMAGIMTILGGTLILLGRLDPWRAIEAAGSLSLAMIAMAGALAIVNKFGSTTGKVKGPQTLKIIAVMAAVAIALGAAISIIGQLDAGKAWNAMLVLSTAMGVMALLTTMMNTFGSGGSVGSILAMSAAIIAIGVAIRILAEVPADKLWTVCTVLSISMVVLAGAVVALAWAFTTFAPGAALVVGALLSIALVAVAVGAAAVLFAGALYIVGEALPSVATGLTMLITSLAGCFEHAGEFVVVCAALFAGLTLITVGLAVLSVGVIVAAAAMLVGVTLLSVGLVILSAALVVASIGLIALGAGLLVAGAGAYVFGGGVMFVAEACQAVATVLPAIAEGLAVLIQTLAGCSDSAWAFIGVCAALVIGITLLTVTAAIFTVGAALMTVGLAILSVGLVVVSAAIVLFAGALLIGAAAVYVMATALSFLGTCITDGLAAGVAAGIETVTAAVTGLAESVVGTICSVLGINSPSVVMQALGQFTGQGFALGISDSEGEVSTAATDLAKVAEEGLGNAGAEGGTEFNAEALSNMDIDSLLSGSSIDTSSLTNMFGTAGAEGGNAFNTSALENMDFDSILSGDGMDMSALTGAFGDLGIDSGTAFSTGARENASMKPTLDAMLEEISSNKPRFSEAGSSVLKAFGEGLRSASSAVTSNLSSTVQSMAAGIRGKYYSFKSAGTYLVDGFAAGIRDRAWYAKKMARQLADDAYEAAKRELDIHSPSRAFRELGGYVSEGFALGIDSMSRVVDDSVGNMAGSAIDSTRDLISRIADTIDADIDSQPTIRPVLDLSDVEAGAGAIGGMFGANSIGLSTVGSISTMMNRRSQNGGNGDVVSAIDKLRKDLGNVGNTSYNINGITYDRGSELDDALRTIVRYAKIEGRV